MNGKRHQHPGAASERSALLLDHGETLGLTFVKRRVEDRDLPARTGHAQSFAQNGFKICRVMKRGIE